jgi:hypothetical protein
MLEGVINAKEDSVRIKSGHFVLLSSDACLVTAGRIRQYCMVISSEPKGEQMMNIQRLVSIGCVGFFIFLATINGMAASDAPVADSNHPLPVRAPVPMQEPRTQTAPVAPGRTAPVLSQPLPQPQPVPVPPTIAATVVAPTHSTSGPVSPIWLLLVVTVISAFVGLMVLGQSRQRENGRFSPFSTLAHGVQS